MKVILNQDVKHLGEEGDIKDVATGYFRNYLFPRNLAVPCNAVTLAHFESRKEEIEAKKALKRTDAASLKERLEALSITIVMPAGANGKLYGAVTNQTLSDELAKQGFDIERKRIEIPGLTFKSVGNYHATVKLYENTQANLSVTVEAHVEAESKTAQKTERNARKPRAEKKAEEQQETVSQDVVSDPVAEENAEN
ncbi:50S ribosomal protein L9 [Treponema phagedenis]|uniref:Large ribosomal subunit protein bL9 n=1 Tax=Treponema phagedenis TaxID=162 RepID=A0A0B7GV99_TREPH|nr:50S ribosomal protein L9 [Treponema phagedenis]EFW37185.1 ribosomal protein L9 [Treponema phagedenis F0421]NVP24604.1 50S ribosomal protein L9 [Treponema phagedenis]QEJ94703.1 50S ribosomal protein L9 [Treponema phagedenis]QEJ97639.1 50S ribosomal protein L9 [Treponema phagedenis]QEK00607.1 50S ribosomal protein L9 [Treponema phagedenis]